MKLKKCFYLVSKKHQLHFQFFKDLSKFLLSCFSSHLSLKCLTFLLCNHDVKVWMFSLTNLQVGLKFRVLLIKDDWSKGPFLKSMREQFDSIVLKVIKMFALFKLSEQEKWCKIQSNNQMNGQSIQHMEQSLLCR